MRLKQSREMTFCFNPTDSRANVRICAASRRFINTLKVCISFPYGNALADVLHGVLYCGSLEVSGKFMASIRTLGNTASCYSFMERQVYAPVSVLLQRPPNSMHRYDGLVYL